MVSVTLFLTGGNKIITDKSLCRFGVDVVRGGGSSLVFVCTRFA